MKSIALIFILSLFSIASFAQAKPAEKKFNEADPKEFLKQLEKALKETQMEQFKKLYETVEDLYTKQNQITDGDMKQMAVLFNSLLAAKHRLNPHLTTYLQTFVLAKQQKIDVAFLTNWNEVLGEVVKNQKPGTQKDYMNYLEFSQTFFEKKYLKNTGAKIWRAEGDAYELVYDGEPKMVYTACDFIVQAPGDTSVVKRTAGTWFILSEKWKGTSGLMDWSRAGLDSSKVYCTFGKYQIDVNKPDLIIDSVKFFNTQFLNAPVFGRLTDKVVSKPAGSTNSNYPKFDCTKKFDLGEFSPGIKYVGGFAQHGSRVVGTGFGSEKAELRFYTSTRKLIAIAKADQFVIKKGEQIASNNAEVKILINQDSIYHPGLEFKFDIPKRTLTISRGEMGVGKIAFTDSYHKTDITTEAIIWAIDSSRIIFKMITGAGKVPSTFESYNYFETNTLEKYTNIAEFNPIPVLKKYCETNKTNEIDADQLAKLMNKNYDESTIKRTLYNLTEDGFLFYNESQHLVTMKEKSTVYVKANRKLIDYDNIKIKSLTGNANTAVMDLTNNSIGISGVKMVNLSDSNVVRIFPNQSHLTLKKNRDMDYSGAMFGGRIDLLAKTFAFKYDSFKVNIVNGDSMLINIPTGKMQEDKHEELMPTKTYISRINGEFAIDAPANKSSRIKLMQYPYLQTKGNSFTYYESPAIHHNAYHKSNFFFQLEPFLLDSLNSFDVKALKFDGTLVSGGIFPDIKQTLTLQKDLALGFKSVTPEDGLALYGGKGKYSGKFDLSNDGLHGDGKVVFQSSLSIANKILFTPDSLNAATQIFTQSATASPVEYPEVSNKNVYVNWLPKQDQMHVNMDTVPFTFFAGVSKLKGNCIISSKGMTGNGVMDWAEASFKSKLMKYGRMTIKADTSDLQIKTIDRKDIAFNAINLNSKIDFEKRVGDFVSNSSDQLASNFVYNQFSTSMNTFHWDMNEKIIDFKTSSTTDTALMVSQSEAQGGLKFPAKSAKYNLANYLLKVDGVPYIICGDSRITPDSGRVYIEPKAFIRPLRNAKLTCDTLKEYHHIYDATVNLYSRNTFLATNAKYDFNSKVTGKQVLQVDSIFMKQDGSTWRSFGFANIKEDQNFALNKKMTFKGYFKFDAAHKDPSLDGFAKLKLNTSTIRTDWFTMNSVIKADSGNFNIYNPKNEKGEPLYFGIMRGFYDSVGVYPAVFAGASNPNDHIVFRPEGFLVYNPNSNEIVYGNGSKLREETKKGDFLKFNDATNKMYCEGKFDLGLNYSNIKIVTPGNCNVDINKNSMIFNVCLGIKLDMSKEIYDLIIKDLLDQTADKPDADFKAPWVTNALAEILSDRELKKVQKGLEEEVEIPKLDLPKDLPYTFFFTNVRMGYDPFSNSYKVNGNVNLVSINGTYFGKQMTAYMEFGMKKSGDYFNILLETSEADYYYISSNLPHVVQIVSSNEALDPAIQKIPGEKRKITDPTNPLNFYSYQQGSDQKKRQFKERIRTFRY